MEVSAVEEEQVMNLEAVQGEGRRKEKKKCCGENEWD